QRGRIRAAAPGDTRAHGAPVRGGSMSADTPEQQILVPLDGSALAENVLPHAEALARITGRGLLLQHVVTPAETSQTRLWSAAAPADLRRQWEESALTRTHTYLAALAGRLQA